MRRYVLSDPKPKTIGAITHPWVPPCEPVMVFQEDSLFLAQMLVFF
jgi:hypothetical protein